MQFDLPSAMLFDNFLVDTDVASPSEPDVNMKTLTYVRRIESTKDSLVEQDFRGFVSRDRTASATMIVHSGGKTTAVDLKKAIEYAKKHEVTAGAAREGAEESAEDQGFDDEEPDGEFDDFLVTIATVVPKGRSLQTTVILLVDRIEGDDDAGAFIALDSIDSEIREAPKKKSGKKSSM